MQMNIEFDLKKYADALGKVAFLLAAIYEYACSLIDKELPPGQHTKLEPEVLWYRKIDRLQIIWNVKECHKVTGRTYTRREWPHSKGRYESWQLRHVAHPSELKLALEIERCFAWVREASATMTALNNAAKRLDEIARILSPKVRDFNKKYQGHMYGGDVENILAGLYEDQDFLEELPERIVREET